MLVACSSGSTPTVAATGCGMFPTLLPGERVPVELSPPRFARGDVVAYVPPPSFDPTRSVERVARIVGLPGERLELRNGGVVVNGAPLAEPYLDGKSASSGSDVPPVAIPAGDVFLVGDNRTASIDSRFFGPVAERDVRARVTRLPQRTTSPDGCSAPQGG